MSQENVEIVKAAWAAWNAGDMKTVLAFYDPDIIMRGLDGWPEPGPWVGLEEVKRQFDRLREPWDTDSFTGEFLDIADRVIARSSWRGAGHHGPEATMAFTHVYTVRKGKIYEIEFFWDHAEALEAVGLSE